jgi:hypothetical protein
MNIRRQLAVLALVGIVLGFSMGGFASAQEKYNARLLTRGGPNSEPAIKIQLVIESYTTGEEAWRLQQILEMGGFQPFIEAFRESIKGSVIFFGTRGLKINIHVAQVIPKENGRKILLFTERQAWDTDVLQRMDGRYPYLVVELDVNNKGKGEGRIYENAQIKLTGNREARKAIMEMESFNSAPKSLFGVSLVK